MTKWFDMNYHYLQPVLTSKSTPKPNFSDFLAQVTRAMKLLGSTRAVPIILGPATYLSLSKFEGNATLNGALDRLLPCYKNLLQSLERLGAQEVQLHEPVLSTSKAHAMREIFQTRIFEKSEGIHIGLRSLRINLVTYFDQVGETTYKWLVKLPVKCITLDAQDLDLVNKYPYPEDKYLGAGIVSGRK